MRLDPGWGKDLLYTAIAAGSDILRAKDGHFFEPKVLGSCLQNDLLVMDNVGSPKVLS